MRLRRFGCGLLIAAGASVLTLLVAEAALRLFAPQPLLHDPDAFLPDPILGARLRPGFQDLVITTEFRSTWSINEDGHRGPRAGDRGAFPTRILTLGDSFTFGYGVEEEQAWPRRLESLLSAGGAPRAEVLNLGVGGYGTWEAIRYLDREASRLRPDLVLLAFYVGNDPHDNRRWYPSVPTFPVGDPAIGTGDRVESVKRWLGSRLHLYSLVSTRADELLVRAGLRRLVYPFEVDLLRSPPPEGVNAAWEATGAAFRELAHLVQRHGFRLRIVVVPMKHQVDDEFWERLTSRYASLAGAREVRALDRDRPQRIVEDLMMKEGLEWIDLLEGLRKASRSDPILPVRLYWPRDQHWTPEGHEAAARLIFGRLELEGLVPG